MGLANPNPNRNPNSNPHQMAQHGDHAAGQALPGGHASRLHDHHAVREARRAPPTRARAMHTRCTRHARATMCLRRAHAMRVPCRRAHRASAAQHARRRGGMLPAEPRPPRCPPRAAAPGRAPRAASWGGGHRQIAGRGGSMSCSMAERRWPLDGLCWRGASGRASKAAPPPPTTTSGHDSGVRDAHHGSARLLI